MRAQARCTRGSTGHSVCMLWPTHQQGCSPQPTSSPPEPLLFLATGLHSAARLTPPAADPDRGAVACFCCSWLHSASTLAFFAARLLSGSVSSSSFTGAASASSSSASAPPAPAAAPRTRLPFFFFCAAFPSSSTSSGT